MSQARALGGQLDLSGTAALQNDEAVHNEPGDGGQDDDAAPARQTDGGRDGGQVGDPQSFDPARHHRQESRLRRGRRGGIGHEREPGTDQALAGAVVGPGGAAAGQDDPDSEQEGADNGGNHRQLGDLRGDGAC